ncbi:unnamed protein product [Umbelopsis ramanniana]
METKKVKLAPRWLGQFFKKHKKRSQTASNSHHLGPLRQEHTGSRKIIQTWQSEPSTVYAGKCLQLLSSSRIRLLKSSVRTTPEGTRRRRLFALFGARLKPRS